jgi:hypothetical protein
VTQPVSLAGGVPATESLVIPAQLPPDILGGEKVDGLPDGQGNKGFPWPQEVFRALRLFLLCHEGLN